MTTRSEGYAIRYDSKELIKGNNGDFFPKESGYVKSPSIYPLPVAEAILAIVNLNKPGNYNYHIFWVPRFEVIDIDTQKNGLTYQEINWYILKKLPDTIGKIEAPVLGHISLITGSFDHGSVEAYSQYVKGFDSKCPSRKHFLIDKSWVD